MPVRSTVSCFWAFIVLQNILGVNRQYFSANSKLLTLFDFYGFRILRAFCITVLFYSAITSQDLFILRLFIGCLGANWLYLTLCIGGSKKCVNAFRILDQKCYWDDAYYDEISKNNNVVAVLFAVSIIVEVYICYIMISDEGYVVPVTLALGHAVHDVKLIFYGLLIHSINIRVSRLKVLDDTMGSKINRYIMIATSQVIGDFSAEMFVLLTLTLISSYIFIIVLYLNGLYQNPILFGVLSWRGSKLMFTLWYVCDAAAQNEVEYKQLAFHVARKTVNEYQIATTIEQENLFRWYKFLVFLKCRFSAGDCINFQLDVPLHLVDISVNYFLLFVQFYRAYHRYANVPKDKAV